MIIRARAPLRLGLAGGGTDVSPFCDLYGGSVLNATIDLYAYAHLEPMNDGMVRIIAPDIEQECTIPAVAQLELIEPLTLHKAVYNRIIRDYCGSTPQSLCLVTHCDAPPGSGLGSSSTLVVALIKAFVEWLRLPLGEYDIARLAYQIERQDLGLAGGRQDQYSATFGGFNFMEFGADERIIVNPLRVKNWILSELEASIVLCFTGVSRLSAKIIEEQTKNVHQNDSPAINAMHSLKADATGMKEAILKGDFAGFSHFMGKSWEAKKLMASEISNAHIESVFDVAMKAGAITGKISGAGGGGFAMFVVDPMKRASVERALENANCRVHSCHFTKNGTEGWRLD